MRDKKMKKKPGSIVEWWLTCICCYGNGGLSTIFVQKKKQCNIIPLKSFRQCLELKVAEWRGHGDSRMSEGSSISTGNTGRPRG